MVQPARAFQVRIGAALVAATFLVVAILALFLPSAPEGELTLGPARRHSPSVSDFFARLSEGPLDSAAGSANDLGYSRDSVLVPTQAESTFLDALNVDRVANGLPPLDFDPTLLGIARIRAAAQSGGPLSHVDSLGQLAFVSL